ncbi:MAG: fasciclin domain-containing protein [Leptolyngbyaceae cyanobacterium]
MSISMFSAKALTIAGILGFSVTLPGIAGNHSPVDVKDEAIETEAEALELQGDTVESEIEFVEPEAEFTEPEVEFAEPEVESTELELESTEPEVESTELELESTEPDVESTELELESTEPEVEFTEPEIEAVESEMESAGPEVEIIAPEAEIIEPESEVIDSETAEPEAEVTEPEADATEPEAEAIELEEETAEPKADKLISQAEGELEPAASIGEIVGSVSEFSTLDTAIAAAGLGEALTSTGPFTVIAPTDNAFAALPDGVLEALLLPENQDLLTNVLTYHVIPGEVASDDLETGMVATLSDDELTFTLDNDMALVDEIPIVGFDIPATNGLIHIIEDGVLVPEGVVTELESRLADAEADMPVEEEPATIEQQTPAPETTAPAEPVTPAEPVAPTEPVRGLW